MALDVEKVEALLQILALIRDYTDHPAIRAEAFKELKEIDDKLAKEQEEHRKKEEAEKAKAAAQPAPKKKGEE